MGREKRRSRRESRSPSSDDGHRRRHRSRWADKERKGRSERKRSASPGDEGALGKKFVWKKKEEQDQARGLSREEQREREQARRAEAERELVALRQRRVQREAERAQRDEEMRRVRREQEQEKLGDWERREEEFHLDQAKRRAEIRIRERRPKPVDMMAMALRLANDIVPGDDIVELAARMAELPVDEPQRVAGELSPDDARDLLDEVRSYRELEAEPRSAAFWENMELVVAARLEDAEPSDEVRQAICGRTAGELEQLAVDVESKLASGHVDVDFWEQVRRELHIERAKAALAAMHTDMVARRAERVRQAREKGGVRARTDVEQRKRLRLEALQQRVASGEPADEDDDGNAGDDVVAQQLEAELRRTQDPSDADFSVEAELPARAYAWQDKHRPRKPRYFNRVHTGYEWNKYNQTHYDKDNPPPKTVQGYKFNIFYPDLIDLAHAPTYRIERDPQDRETAVLRFVAGPPYEDVAFRIVDREWEFNRKRGFRNTFDRGVLQLHFRFKRHFYRR
ncbi:hypothetical protein GGF46_000535 [Coemansia sp. RSA 552]|nr:hypothetical protein GGF46_000535 [Coemansia sp. RSA 552]